MAGSERYDDVCDDLLHRHAGLVATKMMGMPSLKLDGRLVAGFVAAEDAMVFRFTGGDAHAKALALEGSHLFDPTGKGRPFKDWVVVPPRHADRWLELAEAAI